MIWREVNGRLRPYELDVTVIDLLDTGDERTLARASAALTLVVTLPCVPLLYLGTLLGVRNDHDQVRATRDPRAINRRKLSLADARARISVPSPHRQFLERLSALIRARRRLEAFAPQASLIPIPAQGDMVAFERGGRNTWARCYISLNGETVKVSLPEDSTEICSGRRVGPSAEVVPMSPLIVGGGL